MHFMYVWVEKMLSIDKRNNGISDMSAINVKIEDHQTFAQVFWLCKFSLVKRVRISIVMIWLNYLLALFFLGSY